MPSGRTRPLFLPTSAGLAGVVGLVGAVDAEDREPGGDPHQLRVGGVLGLALEELAHPLRCGQGGAVPGARPPRRHPERHRAGYLSRG